MNTQDVKLLARVVKILADEAETIRASNVPWSGDDDSVKAKRTFDRYQRELRDLKDMRRRLTFEVKLQPMQSLEESETSS